MPKLRENVLNTADNRQKHAGKILVSKILEKSYLYDVDSQQASVTMRACKKTYYNRISKPETFTFLIEQNDTLLRLAEQNESDVSDELLEEYISEEEMSNEVNSDE